MKYSIDIISILYLVAIVVAKIYLFLNLNDMIFFGVLISAAGSMMAMLIKHNHCHLPIFNSRYVNYIMDQWLNVLTGTSTTSVRIIHNMNHHAYINEVNHDWGSTVPYESSNKIFGFLRYILRVPRVFYSEKKKWLQHRAGTAIYKYSQLENIILIGFNCVIIWLDIWAAVWVFILPNLLLQLSLSSLNYFQHDGHGEVLRQSNDTYTAWVNILFFNVGYHSAHHKDPKMHWSLLSKKGKNINSNQTTLLNA